jgi:hypothetical protein
MSAVMLGDLGIEPGSGQLLVYLLIMITVFTHLILPALGILWVYKSKAESKLYWLSLVTLLGSYLLYMYQTGGWHLFGLYWRVLFLVAFAIVVIVSWPRGRAWFPEGLRNWVQAMMFASIAAIFLTSASSAFAARSFPAEKAITLAFPFKDGTSYIIHGGSSEIMNHHFPIRAQKYALDIVKLNQLGIRARVLLPTDLNAYAAFGSDIIAPCSGEVIASEWRLDDFIPPNGDEQNLLGNHVIVFCNGVSVLLAHLKKDSVRVRNGDRIEQGAVIAQIGNSGNTTEPHLHIHAVAGRHSNTDNIAFTAEGIPMLFNGRFLIRNDRWYR